MRHQSPPTSSDILPPTRPCLLIVPLPLGVILFQTITDFNVYPESLKLIDENINSTLQDTDIVENFLGKTPLTQESKLITDEWNLIKLKHCTTKEREEGVVQGESLPGTHPIGD